MYMDEKHREEYSQYEDKMNVYTPDELKQSFLGCRLFPYRSWSRGR